jgi:iron complex outermembrane receptor protein
MRFQSSNERWELTVFGTNLTDERYMTNGLQAYGSFGTADATFGPPEEWGLTLKVQF